MKNNCVKKILITGFFGVNNLGDDIMLDVLCRELGLSKKYTVTILNLYGDVKRYDLPKEFKIIDLSKFKHGKTIIISEYLSRKYDAFFWIGGTCFTENAGNGAYTYMKAFYKRKKQFGYISIGIGNVISENKIKMYKWLLDKASLVTFRDKESYQTAIEWSDNPQMYLCDDLVYLYDNIIENIVSTKNDEYLLISWRSYKGYYEKSVEDKAISELCKYVYTHKNQYSRIYIAILGNDIDVDRNKEIYAQLSNSHDVTFLNSISTKSKIKLIGNAKAVVTGRLHGAFIAEINHINTVAIGYDNKFERFMCSINAKDDLIYPDCTSAESISKILENVPYIPDKLIADKRKNAYKNIELFIDYLNEL